MSSEFSSLLLLIAVLALGAWCLRRIDTLDPFYRQSVCWTVLGTNGVYLIWRLNHTLPDTLEPHTLLAWVYLGIELLALMEASLFWLCLSRTTEKANPTVIHDQVLDGMKKVEIWIPTYQEPLEILEKSILAAKAVEHPGLKVRVLDDGGRDWLRAQCAAWGVEHVTRPEHKHAKAGNLNHALASSQADFIVIMDADFAVHHDFVRRVLPRFSDERVAIVQTPQTFYNPDLVQQNLRLGGWVADEQALFFRDIQPARDAWDAAFFCGSCAMLRASALREVGGFATDSITEDLLTSMRLLGQGWSIRYLNERLSMGLAAESIDAFFLQRDRWSRGAIETLFLPDGPIFNRQLSLMQRLLFMPLYWLISPFFHLAVMLLPVICLLTGMDIMFMEDPADVALVVMPTVLINLLCLTWISRGRFSPVISMALTMLMAVRMSYSALSGLIKPGSVAFKVTPKGSQTRASSDRLLFNIMMGLTLATIAAIVYAGWASHTPDNSAVALPWLIFLGLFNLLHFLIALVIVEDKPRLRSEERFRIEQSLALVSGPGSEPFKVHVLDMSASGLRFRWAGQRPLPEHVQLLLDGHALPLVPLALRPSSTGVGEDMVCQFGELQTPQRIALIQYLFSGRHDPLVQEPSGLRQALKRAAKSVLETN